MKRPAIDKLFRIQKAEFKQGTKDLLHTNHQHGKISRYKSL